MRDFLRASDFTAHDIERMFSLATSLKVPVQQHQPLDLLHGRSAAMIFQKPSLRTRATFDIGIYQLGGHAIYLGPTEISLGQRESVYDVAKNLERWVDIIIARVYSQSDIEELAEAAKPPVINALSNDEHPCQSMADLFTLYEHGIRNKDMRLAFVGDGNNVCASLMINAVTLGADVRVASPKGYAPPQKSIEIAEKLAAENGGSLRIMEDPKEAVKGANAVYTDTWASMHTESESEKRKHIFRPYQVNTELLKNAEAGAKVMHCLPAHRGEELTDEVMDGPNSVVFDQAENRLHIQKAIILECLGLAESAVARLKYTYAAAGE
ncbi:MAG: ornithine carbamoyltransferase [Candidatus Sumerlaeaceae bacterium]|nr:ornithine carbamoyltransferase [Candidatus Sumerlaeaceae bacterium]